MTTTQPLLAVEGLQTHLHLRRGVLRAVDGVSLHVDEGETLGIVGESGSGKNTTGLSLLRLLPPGSGRIVAGSIKLDGRELTVLDEREMASAVRGKRIALIAQDPMHSLNPVFSIGDQVAAPFKYHGVAHGSALRDAVIGVLDRVRIPTPERRLGDYPYQFSGGQRQRIVAAMAIACTPRLLIADEPTSALDVTIQAQFIHLMRSIQTQTGAGIILITHDLGVAATMCARIAVMYAGRIVETGPVREIYRATAHPYTQALLGAIPRIRRGRRTRQDRLTSIPGQPPNPLDLPKGCRFAERCPKKMAVCEEAYPPTTDLGGGHTVSCWLAERC